MRSARGRSGLEAGGSRNRSPRAGKRLEKAWASRSPFVRRLVAVTSGAKTTTGAGAPISKGRALVCPPGQTSKRWISRRFLTDESVNRWRADDEGAQAVPPEGHEPVS